MVTLYRHGTLQVSHYKGNLPKGWCFSTIGDLFQHNTGKALNGRERDGDGLRYITTSNLYWDRFDLTEVRTMPFTEVERVSPYLDFHQES